VPQGKLGPLQTEDAKLKPTPCPPVSCCMFTAMVCAGPPALTEVNGGFGEKTRLMTAGVTVKVSAAFAGFAVESNIADAFEAAIMMTCALGDGGFGGGT